MIHNINYGIDHLSFMRTSYVLYCDVISKHLSFDIVHIVSFSSMSKISLRSKKIKEIQWICNGGGPSNRANRDISCAPTIAYVRLSGLG